MINSEQLTEVLRELARPTSGPTSGKIYAIKKARELFHLPLVTAKTLVELLQIADGGTFCVHCRHYLTGEEVQTGKKIRGEFEHSNH